MLAVLILIQLCAARVILLQERALGVDAVCAGGLCSAGQSTIAAGIQLSLAPGSNTTIQSIALLPGTYTSTQSINGTNVTLASFLGSSTTVQAQPGFVYVDPTVALANSSLAILYTFPLLFGSPTVISKNGTFPSSAESLLLAPNIVMDVSFGSSGPISLYDGVADIGNIQLSGSMTVLRLEGSSCPEPCSIGGVCTLQGVCECNPGFAGSTCSDCSQGFFGPTCQPCTCDPSSCSSGLTGLGTCPSPTNATAAACNCVNGLCTSSTICSCSAGWADAPGGKKCSVPATGFALQSDGQVSTCAAGCTTCTINECTSCQQGLQISTSNASVCVTIPFVPANSANGALTTCPDGRFNPGNEECVACDPICATCFGTGDGRCLSCTPPRALLQGQCVDVDLDTGVCDKSQSALTEDLGSNAQFILNSAKSECDAIPANCTQASIPSFSSNSNFSSLQCSACLPGTLLSDGDCVPNCPSAQFPDSRNSSVAVCTNCDSSCATCSTPAPTGCLSCSSGSLLQADGTCRQMPSCPGATFHLNGTCADCSAECAACSTSATACTACPISRPALVSGRCLVRCPIGQFISDGTCATCDPLCASCFGSKSNQCLSCSATQTLQGGQCVPAGCSGGEQTVPGLGVCLEALLTTVTPLASVTSPTGSSSGPATGAIIGGAVGGFSGLSILLFILRKLCMRHRRQKTKEFGREKNIQIYGNVARAVWSAKSKLSHKSKRRDQRAVIISEPILISSPALDQDDRPPWPPIYRTQYDSTAMHCAEGSSDGAAGVRFKQTNPFLASSMDGHRDRRSLTNLTRSSSQSTRPPPSPHYPPRREDRSVWFAR